MPGSRLQWIGTFCEYSWAASRLRISAQTVSRRITDLERLAGVRLLARGEAGLSLTPAGERLYNQSEEMRAQARTIEAELAEAGKRPVGRVRLSITEVLSGPWLIRSLPSFAARHPGIDLDIYVDGWPARIKRGEADVVLRLFGAGEENLVGRKIARLGAAIYCAKSYARSRPLPLTRDQWKGHSTVGIVTPNPLMEWFDSVSRSAHRQLQCSSHADLLAAIRAGVGCGPLMCITGDADESLQRISPAKLYKATDVWLLSHPDLSSAPHVRAVLNHIIAQGRADRGLLSGIWSSRSGIS
ncbi:LysR family transcriptional regulator [Bradyrhizobium sp. CCBAU 11434]|uniref:LysR family transcriptional regulator n=1 Tax=Bradyrhizobium sp. CCBAU 11434 TaxID=1630885 RepID=UPI002FE10373